MREGRRWINMTAVASLIAACSPSNGSTDPTSRSAASPGSARAERGIFADVRGWIVYGDDQGIWAVDPATGGPPSSRVRLSDRAGEPLAWSRDGSTLLLAGHVSTEDDAGSVERDLFTLSADGTETRVTWEEDFLVDGSIDPEGSEVVYAVTTQEAGEEWRSAIYSVEADGGPRTVLLTAGEQTYPDDDGGSATFRTALFDPTFSPDGTQIAYFDGMGDWGNSLWVMNADGSDPRVVIDCSSEPACPDPGAFGHVGQIVWSSDGSHLAFSGSNGGAWVVGSDGSGLEMLAGRDASWSPSGSQIAFQLASGEDAASFPAGGIAVVALDGWELRHVSAFGRDPVWSPDGSRVAFLDGRWLYVADADGTNVRAIAELWPSHRPRPVVWAA